MAGADYYSCDVCGSKAFYDASLNYDFDNRDARGNPKLDYVGAMACICEDCAKTHKIEVVAIAAPTDAKPLGLTFDGYHDSDEHFGKTILDIVRSRLETDPDDLAEGDVFYVSACWVQPQEWRVVRSGNPFEVERVSPPANAGAKPELTGSQLQRVCHALEVAMNICDSVPTRAQDGDDEHLAQLGRLVNAVDGSHGYAVIRDALDEVRKAASETAIPHGAALGADGTTYHGIAEIYHRMEEGEALHMWLNDRKVARADADEKVYSLVGRVQALLAGAPTDAKPDAIERRTEDIRQRLANPTSIPRSALLHYAECLLAHVTLLKSSPQAPKQEGSGE